MKGLLIRVDFKGCAIIGRTCDPELDGFGDVEELWKHWDGPPYVSASALFHCLWFLITTWITTFTTFTTHHPLTTLMTLGNNENFSPWDSRHLGITVAPPDLFAGPAFRRSAHIEASVKRIGWSDRWILRQAECQNGRVFQWIMWYQLISIDISIDIIDILKNTPRISLISLIFVIGGLGTWNLKTQTAQWQQLGRAFEILQVWFGSGDSRSGHVILQASHAVFTQRC